LFRRYHRRSFSHIKVKKTIVHLDANGSIRQHGFVIRMI